MDDLEVYVEIIDLIVGESYEDTLAELGHLLECESCAHEYLVDHIGF